jgi:hypothetical protein
LLLAPLAAALPLAPNAPQPAVPAGLAGELLQLVLAGDAAGIAHRFTPPAGQRLADTVAWVWEVQGRTPVAPLPALPQKDLAAAVAGAYATLALPPPTQAQTAAMRAQQERLPGGLAAPVATLVAALAAHPAPDLEGPPGGPSPLQRASALRVARATDALADALRSLGSDVPRGGGFLFRDPLDLVLVGDAGSNLYEGNAGVPMDLVTREANLLTVDLGGDDVYTNNAGAAYPLTPCFGYVYNPYLHHVLPHYDPINPFLPRLNMCGNGLHAAAAVDLAGDDRYVAYAVQQENQHQTAQGAGMMGGLGVLLDMAGDDLYHATAVEEGIAYQAVQGSGGAIAYGALGLLFDLAGDDQYVADQEVGAIQRDWYFGQQRAQAGDDGVLADFGGNDTYLARQEGPEQSWQLAQGLVGALLDLGGQDRYEARQATAQGSYQLAQGGDGLLVDTEGDEVYLAEQSCPGGCNWQDVQGSAEPAGFGVFVEMAGDDQYLARTNAAVQRAQAGCYGSPCFLFDLAGRDRYEAVSAGWRQAAQGGSSTESVQSNVAVLFDAEGDDAYDVGHRSAQGIVWAQGAAEQGSFFGSLIDRSGNDRYAAPASAKGLEVHAQGDGTSPALFLDLGGADAYTAPGSADGQVWARGLGVGIDQELT